MASNRKLYENTQPALIIPDHFFCNQSSKVVVIYDDPIGEEEDVMTLMFPGDVSGSSPKRVVPERIGTRTLVFDTPVYSSCRGVVEVLPLLNLQNGEVAQLAHFKLTLKHPIRNVMELCLNLSTNNAILPVLLSLMVHCQGDNCKEHFQDPHIDRVMATLVGSRTPGDSTCIQDIILPSRKWRRLNLAEFARHFSLTEMEKQAYVLNKQRSKWASKAKNSPKRTKTVLRSRTTDVEGGDLEDDDEEGEERLHQHLSNSTPDIHTIHTAVDKQEQRDSGVSDDSDIVQKFVRGAKFVCRVVEDFTPSHDQPSCIPLRVNQEVHIVQESNPDWWYGVCEDRCGYFPPSNVQTLRAPTTTKMRSTTSSQRPLNPRPDLSASFHEELSSHRLNFRNMSSAHERTRTESERNESSQPESPRRDRLRTTPNRMIVGSGLKRREDCGSSGAQSDSGLAIIEESISSKRPSVPSTRQQLLHKVTPILPPNSYKSYHSGSSHLPTSPNHADSAVNSAGYESTNVESSESDGYEDVMSGDEDGTAVKSPWTFGGKTTSPTTVAEKEVKKQFILPFMRDKILPTIPAQQSHKQRTRLHSEGNYDDVIMPTSNYENIALDAFEIVEDHVYDRADEFLKKNSIYQLTASDAHMKAVTQMALAHSQKQGAQTDHQKTESDPLNQKFGRLRQHSVKESADPPLAMSPRTAAFVPPRNVPRPQLSPVHCLNTSSSDSTETQTRWKGPVSPPNSGSTPVVSKVQESSRLPPGAFAFPTIPPKDSEKFDIPTLPSKPSSKSTAAVPSPKTFNPGESPKKAAPMLPPKQAPIPPPRTTSEATIPPTKATHEAPTLPPKTVPKATIPPPRTPNSTSEAPILPSKPISEAPIPPPKTSPEAKVPMWISPLKRVPEAPVPPRRALEPEPETPISPPKVSSSQSNSPAIHPKPLKRPAGAAAGVPTPPPKPSKQEPPPPPPKTGNSQFNKLNGSGDHRKRDLGGHTTFPLPGMRMLPANEIAQRAASLQHELNLTTSKRYYKPS